MSVVVQDASGGPATSDDAARWAEQLELTFPVLADPTGAMFAVFRPTAG